VPENRRILRRGRAYVKKRPPALKAGAAGSGKVTQFLFKVILKARNALVDKAPERDARYTRLFHNVPLNPR
jgi:hypothetical protein